MCKICEDLFGSLSDLYSHKRTVHGVNKKQPPKKKYGINSVSKMDKLLQFECDFVGCQMKFSKKSCLNLHKQNHFMLFKCDICDKKFGKKWSLKIHKRIHLNIKCEICPFCNKAFSDPSAKNKHIKRFHASNSCGIAKKNYVCVQCYKPFAKLSIFACQRPWQSFLFVFYLFCFVFDSKYSLKMHLLTHLERKDRILWKCDECQGNVTFTSKTNLTKHCRNFHGG